MFNLVDWRDCDEGGPDICSIRYLLDHLIRILITFLLNLASATPSHSLTITQLYPSEHHPYS